MSLTSRQDIARTILDRITTRIEQPVNFDRNSTAFDMGVQQERRAIADLIKHIENGTRVYDPKS